MNQSDQKVLSAMSNELILAAIPLFGPKFKLKANMSFDLNEFLRRANRTRLTEGTLSAIIRHFEDRGITITNRGSKYGSIGLTIDAIKLRMTAAQCKVFCERYPLSTLTVRVP